MPNIRPGVRCLGTDPKRYIKAPYYQRPCCPRAGPLLVSVSSQRAGKPPSEPRLAVVGVLLERAHDLRDGMVSRHLRPVRNSTFQLNIPPGHDSPHWERFAANRERHGFRPVSLDLGLSNGRPSFAAH
jgi:hypothetical protein